MSMHAMPVYKITFFILSLVGFAISSYILEVKLKERVILPPLVLRTTIEGLIELVYGKNYRQYYSVIIYSYETSKKLLIPIEELSEIYSHGRRIKWEIGEGAVGKAFSEERMILANLEEYPNIDPQWNIPKEKQMRLSKTTRAIATFPLFNANGVVFGVFSISSKKKKREFIGGSMESKKFNQLLTISTIIERLLRINYE